MRKMKGLVLLGSVASDT